MFPEIQKPKSISNIESKTQHLKCDIQYPVSTILLPDPIPKNQIENPENRSEKAFRVKLTGLTGNRLVQISETEQGQENRQSIRKSSVPECE